MRIAIFDDIILRKLFLKIKVNVVKSSQISSVASEKELSRCIPVQSMDVKVIPTVPTYCVGPSIKKYVCEHKIMFLWMLINTYHKYKFTY